MEQLSDAELIGRSRQDPGCFATIFDRHAGEILRYAHARLGPDLAEDVTAETFLDAFRRRDRYDTSRPDARPWLYGIAVRQIGKHRRALSRQLKLLRSAPAEVTAEDFGVRAAERVTAEKLRPRLAAVLCGLPRSRPRPAAARGLGRAELRRGGRGARPDRQRGEVAAAPDQDQGS